MKAASLLLSLLLTGCGYHRQPITLTAQQVFNPQAGEVWKFQNGYGDITQVAIESAPDNAAGTVGHHVILHFTKDADRAYWGLGIPGAEDRYMVLQLPDGTWRGVADIPIMPQGCPWCAGHTMATLNWHPIDGMPLPYALMPASISTGQRISNPTQYRWWLLQDVNTTDDISVSGGTDEGTVNWTSTFTVAFVETPAYSGPAVENEQHEGGCTEEKWYFAPGMNLVQITPVTMSDCSPADPGLAIKRVP